MFGPFPLSQRGSRVRRLAWVWHIVKINTTIGVNISTVWSVLHFLILAPVLVLY
jgi:hypothetical protein